MNLQRTANLFLTVLMVVSIPVTVVLVQMQQDPRQRAQNEFEFQIKPNTNKIVTGEPLLLAVAIKSESTPVSAVSLSVTYPQDKLELTDVDTSGTSFPIQDENIIGSGLAKIGRETSTPLVGEQHLATLHFTSKAETAIHEIVVLPNSSVRSADNVTYNPVIHVVDSNQDKDDTLIGIFTSAIDTIKTFL